MLLERKVGFDVIVYRKLKPYGFFNVFMFVLYQWMWLGMASVELSHYTSIGGMKPKYNCSDPLYANITDRCILLRNCSQLVITNAFYSVYQEFQWDCINMQIPWTVASLSYVPSLVGYLLAGQLGDRFGRKRMAFWSLILYHFSCILMVTAHTWQYYLGAYVFNWCLAPLYFTGTTMLTIETVGKKYRLLQTFSLQYTLAYMGGAITAYLCPNWRKLTWIGTVVSLPTVIFFFFIPESPRWLVQKQKFKEAARSLNTMARWNRQKDVHFTSEELKEIEVDTEYKASLFDAFKLLRNCTLFLDTTALVAAASASSISRNIVFMNITEMAGNPFLNVSLFGLLRIWSPLAIVVERKFRWFGRRVQLLGPQSVIFLCFLCIVLIYTFGLSMRLGWLCTGLALFAYALTVSLVGVAHDQITCEVYPTTMRATGDSVVNFLRVIFAMAGPQLVYLRHIWAAFPYLGAAVVMALAVIMGFFILPETRERALPDTFKAAVEEQAETVV